MGGFVWAVRSGLVWPPFDPGAAARYYDFMPYILHLPWKEEVLIDAPKRSVYQLSLWLSCHIPPRCRWSVPGPQYARTSPNRNSANFAFWGFSEVQSIGEDRGNPSGCRRTPSEAWSMCRSPMPFGRRAGPGFCVRWWQGGARTLPIGFAPCPLITGRVHSFSVSVAAFRFAADGVRGWGS